MTESRTHRWRVPAAVALIVVLVIAAGVAVGFKALQRHYLAPGPAATVVRIKVNRGETLHQVFGELAQRGVMTRPRAVELYLKLQRLRPRVEFGVYDFPPHSSPAQIVQMFEEGKVVLERITVVEGSTFAQFIGQLAAAPDVEHTLRGQSDQAIMADLGHPGQNPEGRFFPSTYNYSPGTSDLTLLRMAYQRMSTVLAEVWSRRAANLPLATAYQALILASVIEKETGVPDERAHIAGVFINRLRRGMPLQSDPTVIYGLGSRYQGVIHSRDLTTDTPYNTYTRTGLPPTPIALPGLACLQAAVHPAVTDDLYFVATGQGGHHFAATLAVHDAQLRRYLAQLRRQRREAERRQGAQP